MRGISVSLIVVLAVGASGGAMAQSGATAVDWSGFYVSGLAGATGGAADVKTITGRLQYFNVTDAQQIARIGKNDIDQWRPSGALASGYGMQFGHVLVGLEASAHTLFLDEDHVSDERIVSSNNGTRMTLRQSVKADWMGSPPSG